MNSLKFIALLLCSYSCFAQLNETTFKEIDSVLLKKPTIVFLNTKWCKSCLSMKRKTFTDELLVNELNSNYYFISFDAESKDAISFNNTIYNYKQQNKRRGIHELAEFLGKYKHKISYPTLVFLNTEKQVIFRSTSKLKSKGILNLLKELKAHEKI